VRGLEDAHMIIVTERPIPVFDDHSHRLHPAGPVSHPLSRLLSGLNPFIGELNQTDVRRHDVTPLENARLDAAETRPSETTASVIEGQIDGNAVHDSHSR